MFRTEYKQKNWKFPFIKYENHFSEGKLPLVILLHGAGERGDGSDLEKVEYPFTKRYLEDSTHECMIVMPQCPRPYFWAGKVESILEFIDQLKAEFDIDEDRIYLTGMSMGGFGTWFTAMSEPGRFAAIAPVCGGGMEWDAFMLTMPVKTFHGAEDETVPICHTENMVKKMQELGLDVEYTRLEGAGHGIWDEVYTIELLEWLLSKRRK